MGEKESLLCSGREFGNMVVHCDLENKKGLAMEFSRQKMKQVPAGFFYWL